MFLKDHLASGCVLPFCGMQCTVLGPVGCAAVPENWPYPSGFPMEFIWKEGTKKEDASKIKMATAEFY